MDDKKIKDLINDGCSASFICDEINITYDELFSFVNKLKHQGLFYYPNYGNNGEIYYTKQKVDSDAPICFQPVDGKFTFVAQADTHVGSIYDDVKRFDVFNNYILEHDIHFIFHAGDFVDGPIKNGHDASKRIYYADEQIKELFRCFPQYSGLVTICSLGNHDLETRNIDNVSFNQILREQRHDFKVYSSGCGEIKIRNFVILLCHDSKDWRIKERIRNNESMMVLSSHGHESVSKAYFNGHDMCIRDQLPAFSRINERDNKASGFKKYDIYFDGNTATAINCVYYIFDNNNRLIEADRRPINLTVGSDFARRRR